MNGEQVHSEHTDVGAYVLGLLEAQDRQKFEEHLAQCPACAAELAELSGMKDLLSDLGPDLPAPAGEPAGPAEVADLVRRRARSQRRYVRGQALLAAAAAVVLLAGGLLVGLATASRPAAPGRPSPFGSDVHTATDAQTGVHAKIGLAARPWGTLVTLELSHVKGPVECQLIAVSRTGARRYIGNWLVGPPKAGPPGHPVPLVVHQGDTAIKIGNLSRIDINVAGGRTLVAVPV